MNRVPRLKLEKLGIKKRLNHPRDPENHPLDPKNRKRELPEARSLTRLVFQDQMS